VEGSIATIFLEIFLIIAITIAATLAAVAVYTIAFISALD
jgi:hypothetical protein